MPGPASGRSPCSPFAAGSGFEEWQRQLTGPEAEAGIDRACARLPGDAPLIEAVSVVAIESIDMDKMLAAEIERLEGR